MRVLYMSAGPVPYRVSFFDLLAKRVELTVLYERRNAAGRAKEYLVDSGYGFNAVFCDDLGARNEFEKGCVALRLIRTGHYDLVVIGGYNTVAGMVCLLALRCMRQRYLVNVDGFFFPGKDAKRRFRDWLIRGADGYLIAGDHTGDALQSVVGDAPIFHYGFSSLTKDELIARRGDTYSGGEGFVLCVGQYAPYKGIDVLLDVAELIPGQRFVIVGSARKADMLLADVFARRLSNVEVIAYIPFSELGSWYRRCAVCVLPSRQECWGLVVNEAASFGTPVVSTWGAGAAVEFMGDFRPEYLAEPGDVRSLKNCIERVLALSTEERILFGRQLQSRGLGYSIEKTVDEHVEAFTRVLEGEL